jgi:hypothetical protein
MAAILHRVRRGDTVMSICLSHGLSHDKFAKLNLRFIGISGFDMVELQPGEYVVVGDSADPLDLVRIMYRRGKL